MDLITSHLYAAIDQCRPGSMVYPDPGPCYAGRYPRAWERLMAVWKHTDKVWTRTPAIPRAVIVHALQSAAGYYVRRLTEANPELMDAVVDVADLRRRMAAAHPDRGGDPDRFQVLHAEYRRVRGLG